jgi:hypothetical protein
MRFKAVLLIRVQLSDRIRIAEKIRIAVYHISTGTVPGTLHTGIYRNFQGKLCCTALVNGITFYLLDLVSGTNYGPKLKPEYSDQVSEYSDSVSEYIIPDPQQWIKIFASEYQEVRTPRMINIKNPSHA